MLNQAKSKITKALKKYIIKPEVTVQITNFGGFRYYLLGQFVSPGKKVVDAPLDLMKVLSLGKGVKYKSANLRKSYVVRNNKKLPINLYRLLEDGDLSQNIILKNSDTIFIPSNANQLVYFVSDLSARSTTVRFRNDKLNILEAFSYLNITSEQSAELSLETVHILRTEADRMQYITLNLRKIFKGEAYPISLEPGDIIYISSTRAGHLNKFLKLIISSYQTLFSVMGPIMNYQMILMNKNILNGKWH